MNNDVLLAAIDYIKIGFSVIPIMPRGKKPEGAVLPRNAEGKPKWENYQERPPLIDEARQWFETRAALNIAIVTGKISSIIVVDVDGDDGAKSFKELMGKEHISTAWVSTGKGFHGYFRYPRNATLPNRVGVLPGIDIRSDGGYVVAPPSIHVSGREYQWSKKLPTHSVLAELPRQLLDLLVKEARANDVKGQAFRVDASGDYAINARRIFDYQCHCLRHAPENTRNNQLNLATFILARIVKTGALPEAPVRAAMRDIALSIGLGDKETEATIESAFAAGTNDPRTWTWGK